MRRPILAFALSAAALTSASAQIASMKTSSVMANNRIVVVDSVDLPGDGFLVIRSRIASERPLAIMRVKAGASRNIRAALSRAATTGEQLEISVHADYGVKGKFEPGVDPLALSAETRAP